MLSWGKHLLVNAHRGNKNISCAKAITNFSHQLVKDIDMVAYGLPQVQHFGEGNKAGYTLVQLIQTSNITGHFCDDSGDIYLDVFSCKDYNEHQVMDLVKKVFEPYSVQYQVIYRDAAPKKAMLVRMLEMK